MLNPLALIGYLLKGPIKSRYKTKKYNPYFTYWIYQEWIRDFRRFQDECCDAVEALREGRLCEWYESTVDDIQGTSRKMLSSTNLDILHRIPANDNNSTIPSNLVTMARRGEMISKAKFIFMTPRIHHIVVAVNEQEKRWNFNFGALERYLREDSVAAGNLFQKMFLEKFTTLDLDRMPPCYELGNAVCMHPKTYRSKSVEAAMPWKGLGQRPIVNYISLGKGADGNLHSKEDLRAAMEAVVGKGASQIHLLIPCAENWATWDAAIFLYSETGEKRVVHFILLQTTTQASHSIYARGLDMVRDVIPEKWKDEGIDVQFHYILVLLTGDGSLIQIPKWRPVLFSSVDERIDRWWSRTRLRQYVMFVPLEVLASPLSKMEERA